MFESMGICHALFAKENPHLYRLYFLRNRENITSFKDLYDKETTKNVADFIAKENNISIDQAKQLHQQMMIFNIGISFVLTTIGENADIDEVKSLLQNAHKAFKNTLSI